MMIDLTYHCSMGCTHCLSDCKPDGRHMPYSVFEDVLAFVDRYHIPTFHISGGEVFEHPDIVRILNRLGNFVTQRDRKGVPFLPFSLSTNGRVLARTPEYQEAYVRLRDRIGKKRIFMQVTDDARFYPVPLTEKEKYRLRRLGAIIDTVPHHPDDQTKCLYPQGRALINFPDANWNTSAPKCGNIRLLVKQHRFHDIGELIIMLTALQKSCTPSITPSGGISLGESSLCPTVASIYDTSDEIMHKIQAFRCDKCQIPLEKAKEINPLAYAMLCSGETERGM